MPPKETAESRAARGRKLLVAGAIVQTVGLAIVGTSSNALGSWVVLGGWILLVYGLHTFGRASEDVGVER